MSEYIEITIPQMEKEMASETARIANARMRERFLNDSAEFVRRMREARRSERSLTRLKMSWAPLEPRVKSGHKIVMMIRPSDVWWLTPDERSEIQALVMESAMQAIKENKKRFITSILQDAISEAPQLKYRNA